MLTRTALSRRKTGRPCRKHSDAGIRAQLQRRHSGGRHRHGSSGVSSHHSGGIDLAPATTRHYDDVATQRHVATVITPR